MAISKSSPNRFNQKPTNRFSFTTTISSPSSSFSSSSSSESMMDETIKNAESVIEKWEIDSQSSTRFISVFHENRGESTVFINSVKGLHRAMRFLVSHDLRSEKLALSQRLMQVAMKRLEREFYLILSDNREYLEGGSVSSLSSQSSIDSVEERQLQISDSDVKQPSTIAISNLRLIADTMIGCGYGKECIVLYKIIRKSTIDEALFHLGIQPYTSSSINKMVNAPHFDDHVKNWLTAVQIAMKTLFRGEKLLCNRIFTSSVQIRDSCFENSTKEGAMNLFAFPELITAMQEAEAGTIFAMMELIQFDLGSLGEIESLFSNESVSLVKIQALSSLHKLGDFIRTALEEMESSIHKDSSKLTYPPGNSPVKQPRDKWITDHEKKLKQYVSSYEPDVLEQGDLVFAGEFLFSGVSGEGEDERCMKMLMRLSPENMAKYLSELFAGTSRL
ncbi:hypothetical protein OSB04_026491 [Centaurea solstitialis]|uniref:Exocyst subunit Exo70 family protein n=1 Tax=Centaurea solstitialis TaxID=347529 RepID=A0AA38SBZ7_9ASTR|nr:hypothetical protein OSB04_026491 [Centaurea solstitialis]